MRCLLTVAAAATAVLAGAPPAGATGTIEITGAPAATGADTSLSWTFDGASGPTSCELDRGTTVISPLADCTSPASYDVSSDGAGAYTFTVYDAATASVDTSTPSATSTVTVVPGQPVITAEPHSPSNDATPTWSFTIDAGATATCEIDGSTGTAVFGPAACTSPFTHDIGPAGDGSYTLTVTPVAAGVDGQPVTSDAYVLDTTAPPAPSLSAPASPSRDRTPQFSFDDTESGVTYTCAVSGPATVTTTCTSPATLDLTGDPDGTYTLAVKAVDAAGNTSPATKATYTLQAAAPPAPKVTADIRSPSNDRSPTFTVSDTQSGLSFSCAATDSTGAAVTVTQCGSTTILDLTGAADGPVSLTVTATDAVGNTSSTTGLWTLDTTAPPAPAISFITTSPGNSRAPQFGLSDADPSVNYTCTATDSAGNPLAVSACGATTTLNLTGAPDGTVLLDVSATDAAGNTSGHTTIGWTLDTTPPSAPTVTPPASPSSATAPTFTISDPDPDVAGLQCKLTAPGGKVVFGPAACPSPATFDTTGFADGTYTLTVTASDVAGNVAPTTSTWTRDTTAPAAPVITVPSSPANSRSPVFSVSEADATATLSCQATDPSANPLPVSACGSSPSLNLTGRPDGDYTLTVTATDPAGNSSSASATYTLDTMAPPAPTVTGPAGGNSRTVTTSLTDAEAGVTFTCTPSGPGAVTISGCSTAPRLNIASGASDGTYTLAVTATDAAGNVSPAGDYSYVLDTTPPPAPTINGPSGAINQKVPAVAVIDSEPTAVLTCHLTPPGGSATAIPCPTGSLDTTAYGDGKFVLSATATDVYGNTTAKPVTLSWTRDTVAPGAPTVKLASASPSQSTTAVFTVTPASAGDTITCSATGPNGEAEAVTVKSGSCTLSIATGAPSGTYTLTAVESDTAGNQSSASASYVFDATAPPAPTIQGPASPTRLTVVPVTVTDSDATDVLTCQLTPPGGTAITLACPTGSLDTSAYGDGRFTLTATATDSYGLSTTGQAFSWTRDTVAPPSPGIKAPSSPANNRAPAFTVTEADQTATLTCQATDPSGASVPVTACGTSTTLDLTGLADGSYTLTVTATDPAGNTSLSASATYTLDTTPPQLPSIKGLADGSLINQKVAPVSVTDSDPTAVTLTCQLTPPGGTAVAVACPTGKLDTSSDADGKFTLSATATDAYGNSTQAVSLSWTRDTVAPPAPTASITAAPPGQQVNGVWISSDLTPSLDVTDTEADVSLTCTVAATGGPALPAVACPPALDLSSFAAAGPVNTVITVAVTATDAAGNATTNSTAVRYQLDTIPPTQPVITGPAGTLPPHILSYSLISSDADDTFSCWVTDASGQVDPAHQPAACTTTSPYLVRGLAPGTYAVHALATDLAGNSTAAAPVSVTIDPLSKDQPKVQAPNPALSNDPHPQWTITPPPGAATLSCTLQEQAQVQLVSFGDCPGQPATLHSVPFKAQFDLTGWPDGSYDLTVVATWSDGSWTESQNNSYQLDTTPPAQPQLVSRPHASGHEVAWSFLLPPHTTGLCTLLRAGQPVNSAGCTNSASYALNGQADTRFTFRVVAEDAAGNFSQPLDQGYRLVKTTPTPPPVRRGGRPPAPVVTGPSGSGAHPVWDISSHNAVSVTCTLRKGATVVRSGPCGSRFAPDLTSSGHGHYVLTVTAIGSNGMASLPTSVSYDWVGGVPAPQPSAGAPGPQPHPAHRTRLPSPQTLLKRIPPAPQPQPGPPVTSTPKPAPSYLPQAVPPSIAKLVTGAQQVVNSIGKAGGGAGFPLLLLLVVGLFLLVQNRIDRRDPKLALAAVGADDWVDFTAPPSREPAQ